MAFLLASRPVQQGECASTHSATWRPIVDVYKRQTLSSAGSEVSQTASDASVRMDKVAEIQAALASGSYNVSASAVASKVVDSMRASQS